jgi:hypothetical protein
MFMLFMHKYIGEKIIKIYAVLSAIQVQTLDKTGDSGSTPGQALLT